MMYVYIFNDACICTVEKYKYITITFGIMTYKVLTLK